MSTAGRKTAGTDWDWSLNDFVTRTAKVAHAVVLSADGLLLAKSERLPKDRADQLAAVISGLTSLAQGAAKCFDAGFTRQCMVEMERGFLLVNSIADGSSIGVLASPEADLGVVGYEVTKLVGLFGTLLTPDVRATPPSLEGTREDRQLSLGKNRSGRRISVRQDVPCGRDHADRRQSRYARRKRSGRRRTL